MEETEQSPRQRDVRRTFIHRFQIGVHGNPEFDTTGRKVNTVPIDCQSISQSINQSINQSVVLVEVKHPSTYRMERNGQDQWRKDMDTKQIKTKG